MYGWMDGLMDGWMDGWMVYTYDCMPLSASTIPHTPLHLTPALHYDVSEPVRPLLALWGVGESVGG
jgi:hypothetical protein